LKKKISYRLCSTLIAIFFLTIGTYSQNGQPDTVSVNEASEAPEEEYETSPDEETTTYYSDTLKQSFRSIVYDSIEAINTDKGFYYKSYLDSLLRVTAVKTQKPKPNRDLRGKDFFNSIFGIIFWILAIAVFGYLIYRLFLSNSSLFSRNRKNISPNIEVATEEDASDADALLRNAIKNGNYRQAVRYLYLQVLSKLAERKIIELNSNKTNYEYMNEVRKHRFANDFASLTLQYEYVWYGEYPVDAKLFEQIQNSFIQFNKNLTR
jgi:hypothetical protein